MYRSVSSKRVLTSEKTSWAGEGRDGIVRTTESSLPLLWSHSSSHACLLLEAPLSPFLLMNHECMKRSEGGQVNVPWLRYYGDTGSNSQGEAVFRILPHSHTPTHSDTHIWSLIIMRYLGRVLWGASTLVAYIYVLWQKHALIKNKTVKMTHPGDAGLSLILLWTWIDES